MVSIGSNTSTGPGGLKKGIVKKPKLKKKGKKYTTL